MSPLLKRLVELLEPLAQRRGVKLKVRIAAGLLPIQAGAGSVPTGLMNLVTNALDATSARRSGVPVVAVDSEPGPEGAEARPLVRCGVIPILRVIIRVEGAAGGFRLNDSRDI